VGDAGNEVQVDGEVDGDKGWREARWVELKLLVMPSEGNKLDTSLRWYL